MGEHRPIGPKKPAFALCLPIGVKAEDDDAEAGENGGFAGMPEDTGKRSMHCKNYRGDDGKIGQQIFQGGRW